MYYSQVACWALSTYIGLVAAQDSTVNPIKSCVDVNCPIGDGSDTDCRVGNRSFVDVGVVEVSNDAFSTNLTWSLGFQIFENPVGLGVDGRQFSRSLYFGSPHDIDTAAQTFPYVGCAFFLTNIKAYFEEDAQGTCASVLGEECVVALMQQAQDLAMGMDTDGSDQSICENIAGLMSDNPVAGSVCPYSAGPLPGSSLSGVTSETLTGSTATIARTSVDSDPRTNCHPVLPTSNDLFHVLDIVTNGTTDSRSTLNMEDAVSPILTTFFPRSGSNTNSPIEGVKIITVPAVSLSCLRPIFLNSATAASANSGQGGSAATTSASVELLRLLLVVAAALAILF